MLSSAYTLRLTPTQIRYWVHLFLPMEGQVRSWRPYGHGSLMPAVVDLAAAAKNWVSASVRALDGAPPWLGQPLLVLSGPWALPALDSILSARDAAEWPCSTRDSPKVME